MADREWVRRAMALITLLASLLGAPGATWAQQSSVSGAMGAGVVGAESVAVFDLGLDVVGDSYALGLGGRVRVLGGGGVREEEWDEPSELARVVRYLTYVRDDTAGPRASFVAGELGGARLGEGSIIDGYSSGLDIDHRRLGAQLRVETARWSLDVMADDVVRTRLAGLRGGVHILGGLIVGGSVAADLNAPAMTGSGVLPIASTFIARDWFRGRLTTYTEAVVVSTIAAGLHGGARLTVPLARERVTLRARAEVRLGSDRYIPGWIGPLYDLTRYGRLDRAREGGMRGTSGMLEAGIELRELGQLDVSLRQRRGLSDLFSARFAVPYGRSLQAAASLVFEDLDGPDPRRFVVAAELRARLPARMYASFEMTHLYRDAAGSAEPVWLASAAVGGVLGAE